ncbi:MAG: phospholipase A [Pseudomonadota bacterium]|nr:phospholipase A [Pseudomonadota bacterium]
MKPLAPSLTLCLACAAPLTVQAQPISPAAAPPASPQGQAMHEAAQASAAWQRCTPLADAARLACFDQWASEQQQLQHALQERSRAIEASPNATAAAELPAPVRQNVADALATTQPPDDDGTTATGSAGVIGVGLEQGCRDRQFSPLSRFWELETGSSCPTFSLRGLHPTQFGVAVGDRVNRQPRSENPVNTATSAIDYRKHDTRITVSVRTKLASGLLTPASSTLRDSLWLGYTLDSQWQVFDSSLSRPFRNTDHMPELMYVYPTTARLPGGWLWRYTGLGLAHQSNGQSDPLSRSWNRAYVMAGFEKGSRWSLQLRLWHRLSEDAAKDNNPLITRYVGHGDARLSWNLDTRNSLHLTYTGFNRHGSGRLTWTHMLGQGRGNSFSGMRLYTSIFHGYGDSLLDYNHRRTVFSFGLSLVDF